MLEWLLSREVPDTEIGAALDYPTSTFGRRKIADDYPTYEELQQIGEVFRVSPTMLQIAFGLRGCNEVVLLDEKERRQYVEQGGQLPDSPKRRGYAPRQDTDPL